MLLCFSPFWTVEWERVHIHNEKSRLSHKLLHELSHLTATHELLAGVRQPQPVHKPISIEEARAQGSDRYAWRSMQDGDEKYTHESKDIGELSTLLQALLDNPWPKGKSNLAWFESADRV